MDYVLVVSVAFLAAALALLSGFGLGTILTPVFLVFYEAKVAVFLVAIVHLLNNLLKFVLFRKHIDFEIVKRFGVLAIVGGFLGAFGQIYLANEALQKIIGAVLIFLGLQEWVPSKLQFRFPKAIDPIGGFLSGLVGGLIGNQGAIRSAFLLNYKMSKETFIATGVVIACVIDLVRIPIYWLSYASSLQQAWPSLIILIGFTFLGTLFGNFLLKRFSLSHFRKFVAGIIILMGIYLIFKPRKLCLKRLF
ncbi:MAG: sulfite exporter TauE/SafE family protein [Candidatus Omnitrophica bacterium]|nr:sulfite exporter TauE/SafE family protein [Candidatus Omnitrophota bacterium]